MPPKRARPRSPSSGRGGRAKATCRFTGEVWLYPGAAGWHFVTLPEPLAQRLRDAFGGAARGWGSLPVRARIGQTEWTTSLFPEKRSDSYLLPIKSAVRAAQAIVPGATVTVELDLLA